MAAKGVVQPPEGQAWCTLRTRLRWAGRQAWACTAANPRKRWTELLWLAYSPFWITWCLVILVPFRLYEVGTMLPRGTLTLSSCLQTLHMQLRQGAI